MFSQKVLFSALALVVALSSNAAAADTSANEPDPLLQAKSLGINALTTPGPDCPDPADLASGAAENRGDSGTSACTVPESDADVSEEEEDEDEDEFNPAALDIEFAGAVEIGARTFFHGRQFPGQTRDPVLPFAGGWGRVSISSNQGNDRFTFQPYGRYDIITRRDLIDVAEAHYFHRGNDWSVLVGVHTLFWGVTESRHLVDIVNQIDLTGDVDEEDRLGQPMINLNLLGGDLGTFSLFGLFGFREQNFPERIDRLRGPLLVAERQATFSEEGLTRHIAFAARYFNTFDLGIASADFAASYFNGMSRSPLLVPTLLGGGLALVPNYDRIDKVGLEFLVASGDVQLKFEGSYSRQFGADVLATVAGFEYTYSDVFGNGVDVGILGEYLYDDRRGAQPVVSGDNDVFGGVRVTFNNDLNTQFLAGMTFDYKTDEIFGSIELSSRLADDLSVALEARLFENIPGSLPRAVLNREDFLNVKFSKYF